MTEYTYADVIIDPNDPRVEIGKTYFFALGAQACIDYANRGVRERTLERIDESLYNPFIGDEKDYPFIIRKKEPTYEERQAEWVKANNIKVGDKVKVIRKCETEENGWGWTWNIHVMDSAVDKVFKIVNSHYQKGILLRIGIDDCWFPYFVLEKVEEPEKKYVPFNLSKEEDRGQLKGRWIRKKDNSEIKLIWWLWELDGKWMIDEDINPQELLNDWVFEDGSPCGKLVEDKQ